MMPALFVLFSLATADFTIQFLPFLKVSCLSFANPRPSCTLDPHISDHVVITKIASAMLSNRLIKYRIYSSYYIVIKTGI